LIATKNKRPSMTLNGRTTLYFTNDASFRAHHGNPKEDRPILSAAKMYPETQLTVI